MMKVYAILTSLGITPNRIYETMELATKYLLEMSPTAKRMTKRSELAGCEIYDNSDGKTYTIITLNVITE